MKLSPFELEVMQVVWEEKQVIAPDVHRKLAQKRKISYSAVKTIFDRLETKGAIRRIRTYGRTILYGPAVERERVTRSLVKDFAKRLFRGNMRPLMSHALADEALSLEDIAYLEALLEKKKRAMETP